MEGYFASIFEDVRQERSLFLLLLLTDPNILSQSKFTEHEMKIMKNLALEKLHRQRILKGEIANALFEAELN